jgi:outer membrane lipoprotein-sorting protein
MRRFVTGAFVLGIMFVAVPASAETVEEVGKKIADASSKLKSFSAKTTMVTEMKQEGFSMSSKAEGTSEMLRKGEDFLSRSEIKTIMETNAGGNVSKQESTVLTISDGAYTYSVSDTGGMKTAQKVKMQKLDQKDPFKVWKDSADLKLLPDATVDGRAVWVIEAAPKGPAAAAQGKTVLSFDKETGQMIKMIANSPDGKPMTTLTLSDLKVNADIPADRFVFKAPAGVEVQDLSKG